MLRMRILMLASCLIFFWGFTSCNRKNNKLQGGDATGVSSEPQGKPDKGSEEPVGLPGYPLACKWITAPSPDVPKAVVDCFLSDSNGEPANLSETPVWKITYEGAATVISEPINTLIRISVVGRSLAEATIALREMQVSLVYRGSEISAAGRDLLKSQPGEWRIAAGCQDRFTLITTDASGGITVNGSARFDNCDILSSRLMNLVIPNASLRNLPDTHKAIGGSCNSGIFTLTITQTQNGVTVGAFSPQACLDLSSLVNSLGL